MQFDQFGNLTPYEVQTIDLNTFEAFFVAAFAQSQSRRRLFDSYLEYVEELQKFVPTGFYQWIDGSFITNKLNPIDIDFVTFLDFDFFKNRPKELESLRQMRFDTNVGLDGYFVKVYPETHPNRKNYEYDRIQWLFDWSRSKDKKPKGIIQLNF